MRVAAGGRGLGVTPDPEYLSSAIAMAVPMDVYGIPVVVFAGVWVVVVVGSILALVYAVSADARARGVGDVTRWIGACLLLFPALWYWWRRETYGSREYGPTTREKYARAVALGAGGGYFFAATVAPPDPITQLVYAGPFAVVGTIAAYVFLRRTA
jgi:hypothetical protein